MKYKKYAVLCLAAVLAVSAGACGGNSEESRTEEDQQEAGQGTAETVEEPAAAETGDSEENTADNTGTESGDQAKNTSEEENSSNILIAYFTAAENSGVDAEASASYSDMDGVPKGRMQALAEMIQEETGGDLFSIRTAETYPADGGELIDYAADEQDEDARPELTTHIDNLDDYDTIFIGYPNWWGDMPQPLYTFFDEYDFSGKTIIPFNSHNGSRFSNTISTIEELEPDADVIEDGFTINENDVPNAAEDVADWVDSLGY